MSGHNVVASKVNNNWAELSSLLRSWALSSSAGESRFPRWKVHKEGWRFSPRLEHNPLRVVLHWSVLASMRVLKGVPFVFHPRGSLQEPFPIGSPHRGQNLAYVQLGPTATSLSNRPGHQRGSRWALKLQQQVRVFTSEEKTSRFGLSS